MRETLASAINDRAVLRLTYASESGKPTERPVRPLALHFWGSVWTLAAWCQLRQDFRNFRLDRIAACVRTGDAFADEPGKTLADFLRMVGAR
jgi:predicted DNA-binding transcriptional regulator YafY